MNYLQIEIRYFNKIIIRPTLKLGVEDPTNILINMIIIEMCIFPYLIYFL
jgi:hypothetical protein